MSWAIGYLCMMQRGQVYGILTTFAGNMVFHLKYCQEKAVRDNPVGLF